MELANNYLTVFNPSKICLEFFPVDEREHANFVSCSQFA
jgi:hypothetical protein